MEMIATDSGGAYNHTYTRTLTIMERKNTHTETDATTQYVAAISIYGQIYRYTQNTHTHVHNECDSMEYARTLRKNSGVPAVGESCLARDNAHTHIYIYPTLSLDENTLHFLFGFSRQCKFYCLFVFVFVFVLVFFFFWTEFNQKCEIEKFSGRETKQFPPSKRIRKSSQSNCSWIVERNKWYFLHLNSFNHSYQALSALCFRFVIFVNKFSTCSIGQNSSANCYCIDTPE